MLCTLFVSPSIYGSKVNSAKVSGTKSKEQRTKYKEQSTKLKDQNPPRLLPVICGLVLVQLGQRLTQVRELGHVVIDDVGLVRVVHQIVLMIGLRFVEGR